MTVQEYLKINDITPTELSRRARVTPKSIQAYVYHGESVSKKVAKKLRTLGIDEVEIKLNKRQRQIYAVYKGDELLATGTANECAEMLDVTADTIRWYSSPAVSKRRKGENYTVAIRLGEEE